MLLKRSVKILFKYNRAINIRPVMNVGTMPFIQRRCFSNLSNPFEANKTESESDREVEDPHDLPDFYMQLKVIDYEKYKQMNPLDIMKDYIKDHGDQPHMD